MWKRLVAILLVASAVTAFAPGAGAEPVCTDNPTVDACVEHSSPSGGVSHCLYAWAGSELVENLVYVHPIYVCQGLP